MYTKHMYIQYQCIHQTHAPRLLAEYIQYQCIHQTTYIPPIVGMIYTILIHISNWGNIRGPQTPINFHIPPWLLAEYIQYQYIHQLTHIPQLLAWYIYIQYVGGGECRGWWLVNVGGGESPGWWMSHFRIKRVVKSEVVNVWGWWTSDFSKGVVNVWGGKRLRWWTSGGVNVWSVVIVT